MAVSTSTGLATICLDKSSPPAHFQVSRHAGLPFSFSGVITTMFGMSQYKRQKGGTLYGTDNMLWPDSVW